MSQDAAKLARLITPHDTAQHEALSLALLMEMLIYLASGEAWWTAGLAVPSTSLGAIELTLN